MHVLFLFIKKKQKTIAAAFSALKKVGLKTRQFEIQPLLEPAEEHLIVFFFGAHWMQVGYMIFQMVRLLFTKANLKTDRPLQADQSVVLWTSGTKLRSNQPKRAAPVGQRFQNSVQLF